MPSYPENDAALLQRIRQRDQTALAELYAQYGRLVYSLALRSAGSERLAEEATQDTFLKVWHQAEQWSPERGRFVTWLLTIARYTALDAVRRESRAERSHYSLDAAAVEPASDARALDEWAADGQRLRAFLDQLPPEQREIIELGFFQDLSHSELAERLRLPLGTVKTRARLGLQKLRALYLQDGEARS